jgi:hypothetical protein
VSSDVKAAPAKKAASVSWSTVPPGNAQDGTRGGGGEAASDESVRIMVDIVNRACAFDYTNDIKTHRLSCGHND